jgi:citrate lyase subunit gamma (acyl carrier protein)
MKIASCGTLESNDCLITVKTHDQLEIVIESIVYDQFKDQIEAVIREVLSSMNQTALYVHIQDKGALDYAISARLITAIQRLEELK